MSSLNFQVREHTLPGQHIRHYPHSTASKQEDVIKLAIKQYTPLDNLNASPGSITILAAHANGFPKELYEPLWDDLLLQAKEHNLHIRNVWIADFSFQGESGVINEGLLGNDPSWYDHPRDMLHMINHFRSEMPRPIIGVGHSMGGNSIVNLSLMHPRLMETIILIDPVIQRFVSALGNLIPAQASTRRRDRWPSRSAAAAAFKKSKFYSRWDPRVLERWIQFGLRDLPTALYPNEASSPQTTNSDADPATLATTESKDKEVTLRTTRHNEVFTFLRPTWDTVRGPLDIPSTTRPDSQFYRLEPILTFSQLPHVRPPVLYIFGSESALSAPQLRADKLANTGTGIGGNGGVKKGNVKEVVFENTGHLIPMENVTGTARSCIEWLSQKVGKEWQAREKQEAEQWSKLSIREKTTMSDEFITRMQALPKL